MGKKEVVKNVVIWVEDLFLPEKNRKRIAEEYVMDNWYMGHEEEVEEYIGDSSEFFLDKVKVKDVWLKDKPNTRTRKNFGEIKFDAYITREDNSRRASTNTRKKAYITIDEEEIEFLSDKLNEVLACLRAQYLSYQTSHWQVAGSHFYQEHLLLERLYQSVTEQVDVLAEKISGLVGSDQVSLEKQIPKMSAFLGSWASIPDHIRRGLTSEEVLQKLLKKAYDEITDRGLMSLGLDDFLMATANAHEENIYLLQQTINPRAKHISASEQRKVQEGKSLPADEAFYRDPRKTEVLQFSESNAISNDPTTFHHAVDTGEVDQGEQEFEESPMTPEQILYLPGSDELSTLNRFVLDSEDPELDAAIRMNEKRLASWFKVEGSLSRGVIQDIREATDVGELASFYSMGESMIDFDYSDATAIMEAVEDRIKELGLEKEFDKLI